MHLAWTQHGYASKSWVMQFHPYGSTHPYVPHGLAKITRAGNCCRQHDIYAELRRKWHHDKWLRLMCTLHGPNMDSYTSKSWVMQFYPYGSTHPYVPHGLAKITPAGNHYCQHDINAELMWKWQQDKWLRLMYTFHGPNMDTQAQARVG